MQSLVGNKMPYRRNRFRTPQRAILRPLARLRELTFRDVADMGGLLSFLIVAYALLGAFGGQP